jgi:tetratricopeptide (TPR) repeat protein
LAEDLLTRNPGSAQAARDVSISLNKLGDFLAARGQPGDADQALKYRTRELELSEELLKRNPDSAEAARDVSVSLEKLGDRLAARGQPGDAAAAQGHYERGLKLSEELLKRNPDSAEAARDVMYSQYSLGELDVRLRKFESAITHFQAGIAVLDGMLAKRLNEEEAARDKAILEQRLAVCYAGQGRLAEVARAGAKLRELEPKTGDSLYSAACAYGLCAALVDKDKPAPTDAEQAERKKFTDLSLACLREALAAGFNNFEHMKQDPDLAALQDLPEFQKLFPGKSAGDRR